MKSDDINEILRITNEHNNSKQNTEENKYPTIKTIIVINKILIIIIGIVIFISTLIVNDFTGLILFSIIAGGLTIIILLAAVSEFFKIMIDIELNTRNK